jgi:nicotinate-nucleotide--dimethylbenzimidazole phosphoribosyltransferase
VIIDLQQKLQYKIDNKTKPLGALGMLEVIALKAGIIQNTMSPKIINPHIVVFAADHGIAATGLVNPYPQAVTAQMVLNFVKGGAAINVFCKQNHIALAIADAGVNIIFDETLPIINAKIKMGTANYLYQDAMSMEEVNMAIEKGKNIVADVAETGCNTIGFGEMGIGNTSSAALIMHNIMELPIAVCVGRGTGTTDKQLEQKVDTLRAVSDFHQLQKEGISMYELLSKIGGLEIAMMAGAYLQAAELNMLIVVDGFIATAALFIAATINNEVLSFCVFSHASNEQGHRAMLQHLHARPLLQLGMRLGEGTGAALAIPLIKSAVAFLNEMASFETAGISEKE